VVSICGATIAIHCLFSLAMVALTATEIFKRYYLAPARLSSEWIQS
jgi:hypothetical protein